MNGTIEYEWCETGLPGLPGDLYISLTVEVNYEIQPADPEVGFHSEDAEVTEATALSAVFVSEDGTEEEWEPEGMAGRLLAHHLGDLLAGEVNAHGGCSESVKWACLEDWRARD